MSNLWDGKALDQSTHERINAQHYPGTRQLCCKCDDPTGRCEEDSFYVGELGPLCRDCWIYLGGESDEDTCGLCGEPGADKIPHPNYWPGEQRPDTEFVHAECEQAEQARAHAALSQEERESILRNLPS